MIKSISISIGFMLIGLLSWSQDTIYLKNGDIMVGELKSLNHGVVEFETEYSDSDFQIEWKGMDRLTTQTIFLITTSDGERLNGNIVNADSTGISINDEGNVTKGPAHKLVFLKSLDSGFWSKISANVDIGLNLTKAKNLRQLTVNSGVGYMGENWSWNAVYNSLNASQDSVSPTLRRDGGLTVNRFLPHDIFVTAGTDYLSNTEQLLDFRMNARLGLGYYFVHSNKWFWSGAAGVAYVDESFTSGENNLQSTEGFFSTELSLFDFGDLSFYTKIVAYPGITEKGRFRSDININFKYDLPIDFYIKTGATINYDNQPTAGAPETDYVLNTGFGWEW